MEDFSAFEEVELTEEQKRYTQEKKDLALKMRKEEDVRRRLNLMSIDYKAVQLYFRILKPKMGTEALRDAVRELTMIIQYEFERTEGQPQHDHSQLMCARGLIMLMHSQQFDTIDFINESIQVMEAFQTVLGDIASEQARQEKDFMKQHLLVKYLASCPTEQFHHLIMQLQSVLGLTIIANNINMVLIKQSIKILDILYWVNQNFR